VDGKESVVAEKREEIFAIVKEPIEERGIETGEITYDSHLAKDLGLDSLDVTELTLGLEERFGIEIPDEELEDIGTVGDAVTLIEKKLSVGA
jgi:acyl carrier protein